MIFDAVFFKIIRKCYRFFSKPQKLKTPVFQKQIVWSKMILHTKVLFVNCGGINVRLNLRSFTNLTSAGSAIRTNAGQLRYIKKDTWDPSDKKKK